MNTQPPSLPLFSSLLVGHLMGSLGFAAGITSPELLKFLSHGPLAVTASFLSMILDIWHLPFLVTINMLFWLSLVITIAVYTTFAMLLLTMVTCPIAFLAAKRLTPCRLRTTLYGALVGLTVGLPSASAIYGSLSTAEFFDPGWVAVACAAGALFAQPIWTWCIRPRVTAVQVGAPEPRPRPGLLARMVAWLALPAAYLVALILFG